jgi:hypothetical protein
MVQFKYKKSKKRKKRRGKEGQMNTLHFDNKALKLLSGAVERARAEKPRIQMTATFGQYRVLSSDGQTWYTVTCNSDARTITCECPARKPCKHIAAIIPIHTYQARLHQERAIYGYCECGREVEGEGQQECENCIAARQRVSRPNSGGGWTSRLEPVVSQDTLAKDKADIFG